MGGLGKITIIPADALLLVATSSPYPWEGQNHEGWTHRSALTEPFKIHKVFRAQPGIVMQRTALPYLVKEKTFGNT